MQAKSSNEKLPHCSAAINGLSWLEKEKIYKEWCDSGLSKRKFCEQRGINKTTFAGWCLRFLSNEVKEEKEGLFCKVRVTEQRSIIQRPEPIVLEVSFPNAVVARIKATEMQFSFLLRELLDATKVIR